MEDEEFVSNDGDELPDHEESGGEDAGEMEGDSDSFVSRLVVVPFSWGGTIHETGEFFAGDTEV